MNVTEMTKLLISASKSSYSINSNYNCIYLCDYCSFKGGKSFLKLHVHVLTTYGILLYIFSLYTVFVLLLIAAKERSNFTICYEIPVFVVPSVALDCQQHIWFGIFSQWS